MGEYDLTVGVLLLGLFLNTYLYGVVTYQFIVYSTTKYNDSWWIKITVISLFVLDTMHSIVAVWAGWLQCVVNYSNPASMASVNWTIPFTAVATSFAAIITQVFLGYRVLLLTKSKIITGVIYLMGFLGLLFGCIAGVKSGIIAEVAKFGPLAPYVICWLSFQTATDLLITFVLAIVLARSKTGFKRTDTIINTLIRGAVQTGMFASIFALGDLYSFLQHRDTNLYMFFAFPIGRIYTNTLLSTLNARAELKSSLSGGTGSISDTNGVRMQSHVVHSIQVHREVVTDARSIESVTKLGREDGGVYA